MELGVSKLELAKAKTPIPDYGKGPDPYQGIQVHDYQSVSFLRMDPRAKAASKAAIELLGAHYSETLRLKVFVNVPLIMQWVSIQMDFSSPLVRLMLTLHSKHLVLLTLTKHT
jgi:phosphatidylinositol transfer protein SFH5